MDETSHKICLITRKKRDKISDDVDVTPITDFVKSQLAIRFRNLQTKEQIRLYDHFSRSPSARHMTSPLFEAYCQLRFQTQIHLEVISMVRLPDPDPKSKPKPRSIKKRSVVKDASESEEYDRKRRPQWHSSHVELSANLEELRKDALSRTGLLKVSPSETREYNAREPVHIMSDIYYLPKQENQVAFDSFILHENFLHIFQFTGAKQHGINKGLVSFFEKCDAVPPHANWRFIFVIPHDVDIIKCPVSSNTNISKLQIFSAIVPVTAYHKSQVQVKG